MNKLYVFGCSYAYGHGLEDCIIGEVEAGEVPSKLGWANMVGDAINRDVTNLSDCGSSNKQIMYRINLAETDIDADSAVICQWSFIERSMRFKSDEPLGFEKIGTWIDNLCSKYYYKHYQTDIDDIMTTTFFMNAANLRLKRCGTNKVLHLLPPFIDDATRNKIIELLDDDLTFSYDDLTKHQIDLALDNNHPGPVSNKNFAVAMIDEYGEFLR